MTWHDGAAGRSSAMPDVWLSVHMQEGTYEVLVDKADLGVADRVDPEVVDLADGSADWSPRYDLVLRALRCGQRVRSWSWTSGQQRPSPRAFTGWSRECA